MKRRWTPLDALKSVTTQFTYFFATHVQYTSNHPGGYLVERWVRGCAAQIGCFFGLSGLPMALFYLKIGLDIGRVFAK